MRQRRYFQILTGSISRKVQGYECEKIHSPWLRSSMRFRSLDCDGDERAWWFHGRDGNARRFHAPHGNARRFHATFDGTRANAPRSDDEFTLALPTLWQSRFQSK